MNDFEKHPPAEKSESASVEGLQQRMAKLREQMVKKREEAEEQVEQSVDEKAAELETIFADHEATEQEKQKVLKDIAVIEGELQEYEQVMREAEELGVSVDEDKEFMAAFKTEKDKLSDLDQRKEELMARAKGIASNPKVMEKVEEGARQEYAGEKQRGFDKRFGEIKQQYADIKTEQGEALATVEAIISENIGPGVDKILADESLVKALELEGKSREELSKLLAECYSFSRFGKVNIDFNMNRFQALLLGNHSPKTIAFSEGGAKRKLEDILYGAGRSMRSAKEFMNRADKYVGLEESLNNKEKEAHLLAKEAREAGADTGEWRLR